MSQEIVRLQIGDRAMDHWVVGRMIDWAASREADKATKDALRHDLEQMAAELVGTDPSPVERLLGETAAMAWFALRLAEAQHIGGATSERGLSVAQSDHHQRRVDRAHRRLMATLKTLATVRRLANPAVLQVNVARQQVIAGSP